MYRCEECLRDFKTAQALAGHNQFRHGGRPAAGAAGAAGPAAQQLTKAQLQQLVAAQVSNAQQLEDLVVNGFQQLDEKFSMLSGVVDGLLNGKFEHGEHGQSQHAHDPATCDGCRDFLQEFQDDDDGQPTEHQHGDDCPDCVHEQLKGVQRSAVWHDKNVPGSKEAREHAMIGEQKVTIVQ